MYRARSRLIIVCFVVTSVILVAFPGIDLYVTRLFYDGGFSFTDTPLQKGIREATTWFLVATIFVFAAAYSFNRLFRRNWWGVDGRKLGYLVLVLALGAGLIVNFGFKDHFGRARPRNVAEFGGSQHFTPAFAISSQCHKNCSFSSGEAAAGFFSIAIVYALGRRSRVLVAAAAGFGAMVSLARIAAGAHFLSDVLVSFFVMWLVADWLHYFMRIAPYPAVQGGLNERDQARAHQVV
jgi:lipid A 4'-phosphatase